VQAAVAAGKLDPERLERWRKLLEENRDKTPAPTRGGGPGSSRGRRR
jgi:ribosome biogenesis GTPase